ncbi:putative LRR receptor-like serine/threonine-protein kinase [Canna indica]|uniref:LRR receptor-like serine/threonine-protein kinase n=1 Tax=Canna indica TaxID=4628 RepID=A0AAQ3JXA0_9LILI|nr:putative LRR receptor-like serine/threonine-protein kinase [Canna indica]
MRLSLVWFLLYYASLCSEAGSAKPLSERRALYLLRGSLAVRTADWPLRLDPCHHWIGVKCGQSGRVISLDLTTLRPRHGRRLPVPPPSLRPDALRALPLLATLNASGFPLPGPIPDALGDAASLSVLSLARTGAHGPIPRTLGRLGNLTVLDLSGNSLNGSVPAELGRLSKLASLSLSFNLLSGALPEGLFSGRSQLRSVKLDNNDFNSGLPDSLLLPPQLELLDLSSNRLTGELRVDFAVVNTSTKGGVFNLSNNLLYGLLPSEFSRVLQRFSVVDLSSNYFEGNESVVVRNASLNCFSGTSNQRLLLDCQKFYMERGLKLDADSSVQKKKKSWQWWYALIAAVLGLVFLAGAVSALVLCIMRCRARSAVRKDIGSSPPTEATPPSSVALTVNSPEPGNGFSYEQLLKATSGFGSRKLIKNGHSGDLYHGVLEDGVEVVVKRIDLQTARRESFLNELNLFKNVSGARLVPFLGQCLDNENEKLIVYKYMSNGDLSSVLQRNSKREQDGLQSLDWIKRLKIALGIAEALCFLHHESNPPLVHRDIEAGSILLDDKYEVRLGSLGEVCAQQFDVHQNVLTRILRSSQASSRGFSGSSTATCAYDIYCLGKVLLELITGKMGISGSNNSATNKWLEETMASISIYDKEIVSKIIDPTLMVDEDHMEEVWAVAVVAKSCLDPRPAKRPLARHVVKALESPLKVVREVNYPSISSSRGSWHSALVGGWLHSFSSIVSVRPVEEGQMSKNVATSTKSRSNGEEHSSTRSKEGFKRDPPTGHSQQELIDKLVK